MVLVSKLIDKTLDRCKVGCFEEKQQPRKKLTKVELRDQLQTQRERESKQTAWVLVGEELKGGINVGN